MAHPFHLHRTGRVVRLLGHEALHQRHIHRLVAHLHGFQDGIEVLGRESLLEELGKRGLSEHLAAQFIGGRRFPLRVAFPESRLHVVKGRLIALLGTFKGGLLIGLLAEKLLIELSLRTFSLTGTLRPAEFGQRVSGLSRRCLALIHRARARAHVTKHIRSRIHGGRCRCGWRCWRRESKHIRAGVGHRLSYPIHGLHRRGRLPPRHHLQQIGMRGPVLPPCQRAFQLRQLAVDAFRVFDIHAQLRRCLGPLGSTRHGRDLIPQFLLRSTGTFTLLTPGIIQAGIGEEVALRGCLRTARPCCLHGVHRIRCTGTTERGTDAHTLRACISGCFQRHSGSGLLTDLAATIERIQVITGGLAQRVALAAFVAGQQAPARGFFHRHSGILEVVRIVAHAALSVLDVRLCIKGEGVRLGEAVRLTHDLRRDALLTHAPRQIQPMPASDHLLATVQPLPEHDGGRAQAVILAAEFIPRHHARARVAALFEVRHIFGKADLSQWHLTRRIQARVRNSRGRRWQVRAFDDGLHLLHQRGRHSLPLARKIVIAPAQHLRCHAQFLQRRHLRRHLRFRGGGLQRLRQCQPFRRHLRGGKPRRHFRL